MSRIEPGMMVDGFFVGEKLHAGGMAALYACTHPEISAPLILKTPKLAEGEDPAAIVSFEMEQMILPRLSGPHVPKVYAVGDHEDHPYLIMERLPGGSLKDRLDDLPLAPEEVAAIGARVAAALDALHRRNVIHFDIKPSNVMFRETGEAVLIDFGLAHDAAAPDLMAEEFRLPYGTAPYMAPEQVLGVRAYRRSDIFALGVLMYFFATGQRPFGDPQSLKGLKERLYEDPDPPRRLNREVPPWLQELILACLEVDPENRPPTAAQLAFSLNHPDQVALTARAERMSRDPWMVRMRRRSGGEEAATPARKRAIQSMLNAAPIVAVAVDLSDDSPEMHNALLGAVRLTLGAMPQARVACLNVLKLNAISTDTTLDEGGRNKHLLRLAALRRWVEPLGLPPGKSTAHVLEALKPAEAILAYARANHVDHIVMGARSEDSLRRRLGSVSAEVAAYAPCTVTVARTRRYDEPDPIAASSPEAEETVTDATEAEIKV